MLGVPGRRGMAPFLEEVDGIDEDGNILLAFFNPILGAYRLLGSGNPVVFIHLSGATSMKSSGGEQVLEVLEV